MGIFSKRNKKKEERKAQINDAFNRVYNQIEQIDSWEDPKKLEHYILDSCEQIIASTKEMERQKKEYRIVTAYLNDIKTIEELPKDIGDDLRNAASQINELVASMEAQKHIKRNISDEQFLLLEQDEDDMPGIINRLSDDEKYQENIKRDINTLEGEKSRWEIERETALKEEEILKKASLIMFTSFTALMILMFTIVSASGADLTTAILILLLLCATFGFIIFIRQNDIKKKKRKSLIHMNQVISILNVQRMKYVNVTNGIEYQKDKYKINSAMELQYVWEQYMDAVRDKERYVKNNQDLEFFNARLERILSKLGLHDMDIWLTQINALINKSDMVEVRHRLVVRRQKIRTRIEENKELVQHERDEIDRLMKEHEHYLPEIKEIISSVDKLCGTSASESATRNAKQHVS